MKNKILSIVLIVVVLSLITASCASNVKAHTESEIDLQVLYEEDEIIKYFQDKDRGYECYIILGGYGVGISCNKSD